MGVITDVHYLSEQLMDDGYALQDYIFSSGKNVKEVPAVLDKVLNEYLNSDIEILFISGDITKDGEKQSHLDFVKKLRPLQEKGIKVYVIPGNHDINIPDPVEFKGNKTFPVKSVTPQEFTEIYSDCGYKDALDYDNASLSYVVDLNERTWLLAIDAAKYNDGRFSSGRILPETEKWIVKVLDEAKEKGIQVVGMMHWGVTEHIMYQSIVFKDYLVDNWQHFRELFADKGMKVVFTGHFHSNDITAYTSEEGNTIYDIETGTLSAYPFAYRFVEIGAEGMDIKTKNITETPDNPNLAVDDKKRMQELANKSAVAKLKQMNLGLPNELLPQLSAVLGQIFVMHAYGDEQMNDPLKLLLNELAVSMDNPIDDPDDVQLDFPPADNNIKIDF